MNNARPKHTRAFSLDAAREGAPYGLECGWPLHHVKLDMRDGKTPIFGLYGEQDQIGRWSANGKFSCAGHAGLDLVMLPVFMLDGRPVFVGDELGVNETSARHIIEAGRDYTNSMDCFAWPADAKHAETGEDANLRAIFTRAGWLSPEEVAKRDLTVANAAARATYAAIYSTPRRRFEDIGLDLVEVVKGVKL